MQYINDLMNYFKNMTEEKIVDILLAVIIVTVFSIFSSLISYGIIKMVSKKDKNKKKIKINPFYLPLKILFICIGLYVAMYILNLPETIMSIWKKIFKIIVICLIANGLVNVVDPKSAIAKKFRKDASNKNKTVANFTGRILKYVIWIFAGFFIITEFGYDISGLVAGLGIGGAIVALAAQDIVKSLIAGMSIISDKPFLVGDFIEVGENQGTVTDISFRCTKIKTVDNTIVTLPNSTITATPIINWSRLNQRRYMTNLKLPLETNSDVMETVVNRIKFVLQANEKVVSDTVQVNFDTINQLGNNINIYLYTEIVNYEDYLQFTHVINNQILKVLESENIKLSYPGQNIYLMNQEEN